MHRTSTIPANVVIQDAIWATQHELLCTSEEGKEVLSIDTVKKTSKTFLTSQILYGESDDSVCMDHILYARQFMVIIGRDSSIRLVGYVDGKLSVLRECKIEGPAESLALTHISFTKEYDGLLIVKQDGSIGIYDLIDLNFRMVI
jgi:hypothetical protein